MQRQSGYDEVQGSFGKGKRLLVRDHARAWTLAQKLQRTLRVHDVLDAPGSGKSVRQEPVMRADVGREWEAPFNEREPFYEVVSNPSEEEIVLVHAARVPLAAAKQSVAVEDEGRLGAANGQALSRADGRKPPVHGKARYYAPVGNA
jgi:hypothetical protein